MNSVVHPLTGHVSERIPGERHVFPDQPRVVGCLSSRQSFDGGGKNVAQRLVDRPRLGLVREPGFEPRHSVPELVRSKNGRSRVSFGSRSNAAGPDDPGHPTTDVPHAPPHPVRAKRTSTRSRPRRRTTWCSFPCPRRRCRLRNGADRQQMRMSGMTNEAARQHCHKRARRTRFVVMSLRNNCHPGIVQ
jgi:hypothetical protein